MAQGAGLLGGVFSIFDLDASSSDLVNSDHLAGITASLRRGRPSDQMRIYHQGSRLGDEFLLRNRVERLQPPCVSTAAMALR